MFKRFPTAALWIFLSVATMVAVSACGGSPTTVDNPPPPAQLTVSCPANQSPAGYGPMTVTFPTATTTGGTAPVSIVATPASGSTFQTGHTTVGVEARSADGQVKNCYFVVNVSAPPPPPSPPIPTLVASPGRILLGQTIALTYFCTNGITATASWSTQSATLSGSEIITPTTTGEVVLAYGCSNTAGTVVAKDTVVVDPVPPINVRTEIDRPNGPGPKHKYVYMTTLGGIDRGLDTNGSLRNTILAGNSWMVEQTGWAPWVDEWGGEPDILYLPSTMTAAEMDVNGGFSDNVKKQLVARGFDDPNTRYVVFVEAGTSSGNCGVGFVTVRLALQYLQTPGCSNTLSFNSAPTDPPGGWARVTLHEMFHVAGAVSVGAPDYDSVFGGHVTTFCDLMYNTICQYSTIDIAGRNYLGDNVPAGVVNIKKDPYYHFVRAPNPTLRAQGDTPNVLLIPIERDVHP